jgi:hypothetical protein
MVRSSCLWIGNGIMPNVEAWRSPLKASSFSQKLVDAASSFLRTAAMEPIYLSLLIASLNFLTNKMIGSTVGVQKINWVQ